MSPPSSLGLKAKTPPMLYQVSQAYTQTFSIQQFATLLHLAETLQKLKAPLMIRKISFIILLLKFLSRAEFTYSMPNTKMDDLINRFTHLNIKDSENSLNALDINAKAEVNIHESNQKNKFLSEKLDEIGAPHLIIAGFYLSLSNYKRHAKKERHRKPKKPRRYYAVGRRSFIEETQEDFTLLDLKASLQKTHVSKFLERLKKL